jgi:hypothetical protein
MPRAGFEHVNPATKRPQTYALDRAATGIVLLWNKPTLKWTHELAVKSLQYKKRDPSGIRSRTISTQAHHVTHELHCTAGDSARFQPAITDTW